MASLQRSPARPAWTWRSAVKPAIYAVGMMPAASTFYLGVVNQLGADPMRTLEQTLGLWALRFIVAGLAITPLHRLGGPNLVDYRRAIGLLAFFYALMHLTVYIALDQGFDMGAIWRDIVKRPYITIGMIAFAILVPLAVTSNDGMVRRMGAKAWRKLHRLVYAVAVLGVLHFILLVKSWPPEPLIYAALIAGLLGYRLVVYLRSPRKAARPARARQPSPARAIKTPVADQ